MLAETRNDEAFALSFVSQSLAKFSSIFDGLYQSEMSFSTYELSHKTIIRPVFIFQFSQICIIGWVCADFYNFIKRSKFLNIHCPFPNPFHNNGQRLVDNNNNKF